MIGPEPEILIANILGAQMVEIDGASYSKMWGNHGFQIYGGGAEDRLLAKDSLVPLRTIREIGFDSWRWALSRVGDILESQMDSR